MRTSFELPIVRPIKGSRSAAHALRDQLASAIRDGRLAAGAKLPAARHAPEIFGVSRNTAVAVYESLINGGLVTARHGSGTYVAERGTRGTTSRTTVAASQPDSRLNGFWVREDISNAIGFWREASGEAETAPATIDLRPALISPQLFPFETFRRVIARQLRRMEVSPASFKSPQGNQGSFRLRSAISAYLGTARAIACEASQVLVTAGAQQAFDLIARALVRPGQTIVAIEDPGYPPLRVPFEAAGGRIVPVPVDDEGLLVDRLPTNVDIICVCPSHQFPLGMPMSVERRNALISFARRTGAVIVEDDYDGEFRHANSPVGALHSEATTDFVFYVGTFSKSMLPSLRLGFVVPPPWALSTMTAAKNASDWHCPTPLQQGVAAFIEEGHLARHVRRTRRLNDSRRSLLATAVEGRLGDHLQLIPSSYGMHATLLAPEEIDCNKLAAAMMVGGVRLHTLERYHHGPPAWNGFVIGHGAVTPAVFASALAILVDAMPGVPARVEEADERSTNPLRTDAGP